MILIIGSKEEEHSKHVYDALVSKNYDVEYFDSRNYPDEIFLNYTPNSINGNIKINGKIIPLDSIQGIYWRWYYGIQYEYIQDDFVSNMVYRERTSSLESLLMSLECNLVNSFEAIELHKRKVHQLNIMSKNGIRTPKTLITNDKDALIEFFENNNRNVIYKPVLGGAFTKRLTEKDFEKENLETLKTSPIQLQEYIDGTDIRVYAMGEKIFSGEIKAETIDFRADDNTCPVPVQIPDYVEDECRKILKLLKLRYSGIDIRRTKENEYVFIEANPAPMFIGFENATGYPITESLIELLTE